MPYVTLPSFRHASVPFSSTGTTTRKGGVPFYSAEDRISASPANIRRLHVSIGRASATMHIVRPETLGNVTEITVKDAEAELSPV